MAIKTFRPKTHSLRFKTVIDYKQDLTTDEPHKPLLDRKNRINGRNNYGQLTVRHRGGGNKKHYRIIDFRRDKIVAQVIAPAPLPALAVATAVAHERVANKDDGR